MRPLQIALVAALLSLAGLAQAMALVGTLPAAPENYSPVKEVSCSGYGRCPLGLKWVCGPYGGCGCVACGSARPYVAPYAPRPYVYNPYRYRYPRY